MCEISRIIDKYFDGDDCKKKEVCERMGGVYPTFCRKTNPHDDLTFNIRELIPYTLNTDFSLIDHIESRLGRVAFQIPKKGEEVTTERVADMIEHLTTCIAEMAKMIADGIIDPEEKKRLTTLSIRLAQQTTSFQAAVDNR